MRQFGGIIPLNREAPAKARPRPQEMESACLPFTAATTSPAEFHSLTNSNQLWRKLWPGRKKRPVFRCVSLRIGRKGPSLRDRSMNCGPPRSFRAPRLRQSPTAAGGGAVGTIPAPSGKVGTERPRPLSNLTGISDTCSSLGDSSPLSPYLVVDSDSRTKS